jgi:type II secretory pathway predicted ATPase ExeA
MNLLLNHFNLRDQPFGVTPDPRYLFLTKTHRAALEGLLYGIHSGLGFIALTAEPGMGKTTLMRVALNQLGNTARTAFLFQAITDPTELFRALLIDLGEKDPAGTLIDLEMRLNEILLRYNESGQRVVVVLDEAQNLVDSVLEAIRMLSNFETSRHKLLQVILCGQQQLADRLATPELVQLRQRISIFATLKPLTRLETAGYIEHHLKVAGYENSTPLFTPEAVSLIAHYGDGIPRNINNICFNSLSIGCTSGKKVIDAEAVREAIADLGLEGSKFGEPTDDLGWQGETLGETIDDPGLQGATFAGPIDDPGLEAATFVEPMDDLGLQEARFGEPTDDLGWQGARFAEPTDDAGLQGETFAEPTDDLGWQRARFANPVGDSEPDEDEFEEPDLSEERETSPGLRVALIAGLLFATALAVAGWNVARSGGPHSPLMSQVTSWFHNSPPVKNQPQVQAPALPQTPASPQVDQSAQTSIRQQRESAAQAATPSQDDSSLQSAIPSQAKPANEGTAQASPFFGVSKPNRERSGAKLRASRGTIPKGGVEVVGARQGQSVAGICVERFNGCSPALLNTIVELNPGIKDQDHLEAGQRVFLPVIESRPQQRN